MRSRLLRPVPRLLAVALAVFLLAIPAGAQEQEQDAEREELPENPYERLAEVKRRQAEAAFQLDLLGATAVEVRSRLAEVEAWVAAQEQVVEAAQAQLVEATLVANRARAKEEAKADELAELRRLMREIAIDAFVRPRQIEGLEILMRDMDDAAKADAMLRAKADRDLEVADRLEEAETELRQLRRKAERTERAAKAVSDEAATALADLEAARLEQVGLAEQIKVQMDLTAGAAVLLSQAESEALTAVQAETDALLARATGSSSVELVDVRGFKVHVEIAEAFEGLLAAAEADGIVLGGWGWRSTSQQVALRRQHCGGEGISDADAVYTVPPGSCRPPTARPGTSMHELGLAIDFTYRGASIGSRDNPAFVWLDEHAPSFGLYNLPSEPWHWSVNGQ